jgi:hypothetical protein
VKFTGYIEMNKPKPKDNMYWLPEDDYKKLLFRVRSQVFDIVADTFPMYGDKAFHDGVTEAIMKLLEDAMLVVRGVDKPIVSDYRKPYWRGDERK